MRIVSAESNSVATPTFSLNGGSISSTQLVSLSTTTIGASIRYTLDGSAPSATVGTLYTALFALNASGGSSVTVRAIA